MSDITIDLRDAIGDRLHLSDAFVKDPTTFNVGRAQSSMRSTTAPSASEIITSARRRAPTQQRSLSGIRRLFSSRPIKQAAFRATYPKLSDGPACRVYGSVEVKKVTGNLHLTTLGHGYMSYEHTDHQCEFKSGCADRRYEPNSCGPRVQLWSIFPFHLPTLRYELRADRPT